MLFADVLRSKGYDEEAVTAACAQWVEDPQRVALALLGRGDVVEAARGCNQHKHKPGCEAADGADGGDDQYKDSPVPVVKRAKSVGEVGAIVTPKPEWSDTEDDGDFVVLEDQGNKILVQALGTGLPLPPTSVWMKDWAELSHEVTRKRTKVKK